MRTTTILLLIVLIIAFAKKGNCGEFASWWQVTPNGNEFCKEKWHDEYIVGIKCKEFNTISDSKDGFVVKNINRWYFYKKNIVGEFNESYQTKFFIFNETTCECSILDTREEFNGKLKELGLNPIIWTRWYNSNWGIILTDGDFGEGLVFMFIKSPLLIGLAISLLVGLIVTKFDIKRKFNQGSLLIVGLVIIRILLDIFPSSI